MAMAMVTAMVMAAQITTDAGQIAAASDAIRYLLVSGHIIRKCARLDHNAGNDLVAKPIYIYKDAAQNIYLP